MPKTTKKPNKNAVSAGGLDWSAMYRHLRKSPMAPRDCAYCLTTFTPARSQDKAAKFCKVACRTEFHQFGGLPMRLLLRPLEIGMRLIITETVKAEVAKAMAVSTAPQPEEPPV